MGRAVPVCFPTVVWSLCLFPQHQPSRLCENHTGNSRCVSNYFYVSWSDTALALQPIRAFYRLWCWTNILFFFTFTLNTYVSTCVFLKYDTPFMQCTILWILWSIGVSTYLPTFLHISLSIHMSFLWVYGAIDCIFAAKRQRNKICICLFPNRAKR